MLNFKPVREGKMTLSALVEGLKPDDLHALTDEMVDRLISLIADCTDAEVVFEPLDPEANDLHAATPEEVTLAWTLGHVIVHTTATAEESAALASELARGVENHGRSRYETPWRIMTTLAACRQRLEESRRLRVASLDTWPDEPHLKIFCEPWPGGPLVNAVGRFALGLMHDDSHLDHITKIIQQARSA